MCKEFTERSECSKWECLELHTGAHKGDCWFWKQGSCKFDEAECGKGRHLPAMFDVNNKLKARDVPGSSSFPPLAAPIIQAPAPTPASFFGGGQSPPIMELLRSVVTRGTVQDAVAPAPVAASPAGEAELRSLVMQLLVQQGLGAWGQGQ